MEYDKTSPSINMSPLTSREVEEATKKLVEEENFLKSLRQRQEENLPKVQAQEKADFERIQRSRENLRQQALASKEPLTGMEAYPEKYKLDPREDVKVRDINLDEFKKMKQAEALSPKASAAAAKAGALEQLAGMAKTGLGKAASLTGKAITTAVPPLIGYNMYQNIKEGGDVGELAQDALGLAGMFAKKLQTPLTQAVIAGATLPVDKARSMATEEQELKELEAYRSGEKLRHNYTDEEFEKYLAKIQQKNRTPAGSP